MIKLLAGEPIGGNWKCLQTQRYRKNQWLVCGIDHYSKHINYQQAREKVSHITHKEFVYKWCLLKWYNFQKYSTGVDTYHAYIDDYYKIKYLMGNLGCIRLSKKHLLFFNKSVEDKILSMDLGHPVLW